MDHVLPKSAYKRIRVRVEDLPSWLFDTEPSCFADNIRKGSRLLAPPSWEHRLPILNVLGIGTFRIWRGDVESLRIVVR